MKKAKESGLRKIVKDVFQQIVTSGVPFHVSWIESHATCIGAPDIQYCVDGVDNWIELKYGDDKNPGEVRAAQVLWMEAHIVAGGKPLFLYQHGICFYVVGGWAASRLRADPRMETWAACAWVMFVGNIDEHVFLDIIKNPELCYVSG